MNAARCMLFTARASLAAALIALGGCAAGPNYRPTTPVLPASYETQAALSARVTQEPAPPLDTWWSGFDDPELQRIIERVLAQNLDLAAAIARVAQARAVAQEAGAREWPEAHLDAAVQTQRQSLDSPIGKIASALPGYERDQTLRDIDAGASWEIDLFGGLRRGAEAARADAQTAEALQGGVRISVAAEAADAYFRLRAFEARIALTRAQIDIDQQLLDLVRQRQTDGVGTDLESAQAKALLSHARGALPPLETGLMLQSNRLDVLMGAVPGTYAAELRAASADYVVPAIDTGEGPAQLLRRRPDVIAAERRMAASSARIGVAVAEYYPKISLAALLGFESLNGSAMFHASSFQPSAAAGLRWRLFDFGRIDAEVAQAKGAHVEALADYRHSMLRATEDVENAIVQLTELEAQYVELEGEVAANAQARAAAQQQYVAGVVSLLEVLDADRQLLASRDALAQVHADAARAAVEAFRALGGGWTPAGQRLGYLDSR
ncbi:MAG TPA: efflux transporter outer membrane subunit [Steroidobacteraceae bacterium]|nr:efflux transporter outer membrane subunit [Steroidobacteraceae bacterium]